MRSSPRTCPSIRRNRFPLASFNSGSTRTAFRPLPGMHAQRARTLSEIPLPPVILIPSTPIIYPYPLSGNSRSGWPGGLPTNPCYNPSMTLLEITYELQSPLSLEQLSRLGEFANTYGLRRFRVDEQHNLLTFEYDASRLRETQVAHVLGQAGIAITRKANQTPASVLPVAPASMPAHPSPR